MLCPKFNTNNAYGATFCAGCGAALIDSEKAQLSIADSSNNYGKTTVNANNNYYSNSPYNSKPQPQQQAPVSNGQAAAPAQSQQPYQMNMVNYGSYQAPQDEHVSTLQWIGIFFIPVIPFIGWLVEIVLMFVWAFGGTKKTSLKNYARAVLILAAIAIVISILLVVVFGVSLSEIANELS